MAYFGKFYLDKEKDIIVELDLADEVMSYVLRTPNHRTGNLITNLAKLCDLPLTFDEQGLKVIRGTVPCYVDDQNREVFVFRLGDTKVANIYPDGDIERKAAIPAISKTLMSQTKDYRLDFRKTLVKTYIRRECKFRTDLHTHMNANLDQDILIALGIHHQIRYPLYYVKKLQLRCTKEQSERLRADRARTAKLFASSDLTGKYLTRKIDDNTFINFADLILRNEENAAYNIPRIRASLAILKDGQAVFTNLEKVYLYRYVFTKGKSSEEKISLTGYDSVPDSDIADALRQMEKDRKDPAYADYTLFQDKLLWIARGLKRRGILYAEISDTTLVKPG
ncbi:MAG: adenosine deaminase, partial [Lachnospiraceae bacterium]|nr:adenosine deaminase [Lachnospiraceae bacterium]